MKVILKEIPIEFSEKCLIATLQNKNIKFSIFFSSLQVNSKLLLPWMVYPLAFVVVHTFLYITIAAMLFQMPVDFSTTYGVAFLLLAITSACR
jgi:hypothetical protein